MEPDIDINAALQNVLSTLEVERQKIASIQKTGYTYIGVGLVLGILVAVFGFPIMGIILGIAGCAYGCTLLYKIRDELKAYQQAYKRDVIAVAFKHLYPNLTINPYQGISSEEFEYSQLFNSTPDRYKTEDLVCGKADKTNFYFAEVHAEYKTETRTKNGTQTHWHNIFKGIMFVADYNKKLKGVTVVRPNDLGASIGAWFSTNLFSFGDKDLVKLENETFNQKFVTYGTDQIEARYILTPALMERLLALNSQGVSTISLSFIESRMYIGFPLNKNYFEAPIFESLNDQSSLNEDINVLKFLYDIAQELDLNTRIWGKD